MFFDNWQEIIRPFIVGVCAYIALIGFLRVSGKRTLSKMNAFDLVVTVSLGSTLATILLSKDVALVEGLMAFFTLIGLQFVVAWLSVRSLAIRQLVKSDPTLLFHQGRMLDSALRSQRVTPEEVRAAVRNHGFSQMSQVEAVILETDGTFSVLSVTSQPATAANQDVKGYPSAVSSMPSHS